MRSPTRCSATSRAATLLRIQDRLGSVEAGKTADLVLLDGDPLANIDLLADPSRISMVMKDGQVFKDVDNQIENTDVLEASQT